MGYYENPQIIQPDKSGEIIGESISNFGESITKGLYNRYDKIETKNKENKLTLQKMQDRKNETDLFYADKMSDWSSKQEDVNPEVNKQIKDIVQKNLHDAADARIKLLNETDTTKRQEYLKVISNADSLIDNASKASKSIGGVVATYRLKAKASTIGKPGGYVVNGKSDEDINNNTGFLDTLSGMSNGNPIYKQSNIQVSVDDAGTGFNIRAYGEHTDGTKFDRPLNTKAYIDSEESVGDGLLLPVESLDTFYTEAKSQVSDKNNNIFDGYLNQTHETVDLQSKGGDQYQIVNGRKLNTQIITDRIKDKAKIKATGILAADNTSSLRTLVDYTLEQGPGWYDKNFAVLKSTEEQNNRLTQLLTDKSFEGLTQQLHRTPNKQGGYDYWNPDESSIKIKEKEKIPSSKSAGTGEDGTGVEKTVGEDYRSEYYNNLISGPKQKQGESQALYNYRSRKYYAENLNRLAGSTSKFITTDDLYKKFLQEPIKKGATLSFADQIESGKLTKEQVKKSFNSRFPKSDMYYEQSPGDYRALNNYNINKASSRAKLALDFTAGEGEIKKLQGKVGEANLSDWIKANPKGPNETDQQYVARYKKSQK